MCMCVSDFRESQNKQTKKKVTVFEKTVNKSSGKYGRWWWCGTYIFKT